MLHQSRHFTGIASPQAPPGPQPTEVNLGHGKDSKRMPALSAIHRYTDFMRFASSPTRSRRLLLAGLLGLAA